MRPPRKKKQECSETEQQEAGDILTPKILGRHLDIFY
jgi:hypothetical protein